LWRHSLNEAPHSGWNGVAHVGNSRPSLGNPATGAAEQLVALKFLLHFVGDTSRCTPPTTMMPAATEEARRGKEHRGFITTGMSSLWSGWELTRVEWRQI
jgi:hypothetical protein